MHSKRHYKICISSVILGELESSRNYQGFSIIATNFRYNLTYYEREIFSNSSFHHIFDPKILGFFFPMKNNLEIFRRFSSNTKFSAIFASPNRYFTENSGWVPLKGF